MQTAETHPTAKQKAIIETLKVKPEIDPEEEVRRSIDFIKEYLNQYPFLTSLVLGISGGQDSTLVGKLCQMAVEEMRDETGENAHTFYALALPYGEQKDQEDVDEALNFIQPDQALTINIQPAVDAQVQSLSQAGQEISDFNKGNMKARQRMITQYAVAGQNSGVVVGTDHAAESVTGFYTKFGDGAADIMPIWRLDKRQGRQLLEYLNCPEHLYKKTPTADLEDQHPLQPDEEALGVSYDVIDNYLEGREVSDKDAATIENLYDKSEHKRHLPINVYDTWWKTGEKD